MKTIFPEGAQFVTGAAFNRNPSAVKRKAAEGPVVITDRGEASLVVLSAEDFARNYRPSMSVAEALFDPCSEADRDFEPQRITFEPHEFEV